MWTSRWGKMMPGQSLRRTRSSSRIRRLKAKAAARLDAAAETLQCSFENSSVGTKSLQSLTSISGEIGLEPATERLLAGVKLVRVNQS